MSFDDVANRMQQRHSNHMVPSHAIASPGFAGARSTPGGSAESIDDSFAQSIVDSERRSQRSGDLVIGGLLFGLGLLITIGTYGSASESGGTYVVAYGPMIVGAIRIFRGLAT